jgi:hypothetical protein
MNRSGRSRTAPSLAICRVAQPGAARVVAVAVEVADPHRVERDVRLAGDQQEPPRRDEVLTERRPSSSSIQACGSGAPGRVDG